MIIGTDCKSALSGLTKKITAKMEKLKNIKSRNIRVILFLGLFVILLILFFLKNNINQEHVFLLKEYYSNKKIKGTNEYVIRNGDTIFNGNFVNYNLNGVKIAGGKFRNGKIFGRCIYYFDNGNIESIQYKKGKTILESIWYYLDGKIERYVLYSDFGSPIFIVKYDKSGEVNNYKGVPQLEIYQHKINIETHQEKQIKSSLKVGDTLRYSYVVANIPTAKRNFSVENVDVDNVKVKRIIKKIEPCQIDLKEVLTKKGKNTIRSIVKYEFDDKVTPVLIDTLSFDVIVH